MADPDDDLARAVADLVASLGDLRDDLAPRRPRGPPGLPLAPRPAEVLRFADDHAIPTAIAVLEANVRALELLRAAIRLADPDREAAPAGGESAVARAGTVGREALVRADEALDDLVAAVEEGALPPDADARAVVEDARRLRAEIDDRLAAAERSADGGDSDASVDVEAELESIRSEVDGEAAPADEDSTGDDGAPDAAHGAEGASDAGDGDDAGDPPEDAGEAA